MQTLDRSNRERTPLTVWVLVVLLGMVSLGGFVGGISFVTDRTGAGLGAELSWLEHTPVHDFLLPGLFLLVLYGIGGACLIVGLVWRPAPGPLARLNERLGYGWPWVGTIALGAMLVVWILYEFAIFSDRTALQPILIGSGVAMVLLPLTASMRRRYATRVASRGVSRMTTRTRTADWIRVPRAAYVLSALATVAAVAGSLGGLFVHHLYRDNSAWAVAALRGGDLATLVVAAPILIGALILARRGSARATLVWLGALGYGVYNFAFYVFGAAFNDLFLVHVVAFAASLYALIVLLPSIDARAIAGRFSAKTPARALAVFLSLVAVVFAVLWTTFSLQYAITGRLSLGAATLPGMHLVFALDLSLMVPSMAIGGALLWRRRPWGYVLASALCVFGALYQVNLVVAGAFQANAHVEGAKTVDPIGAVFVAAFLAAGVVMLRNLRAERAAGAEIGFPRAA